MASALLVALLLSLACIFVHYEVLRALWWHGPALLRRTGPRGLVLTSMLGIFAAHFAEIALYALVFWLAEGRAGLGRIESTPLDFPTALYLSTESYATLGLVSGARDVPMRLVAGTEALTGLVLITWSASFTYLVMGRAWRLERGSDRDDL